MSAPVRAVIADDEPLVRDALRDVLGGEPDVELVGECGNGLEALRLAEELRPDLLFLDIQMPGLTGLELAQVLARFKTPPPIVFVTAHEEHAVDAFELRAVDYVLKPVRPERLAEAVRRVVEGAGNAPADDDEQIPVERGGVTRFLNRSDIRYVEAQGDYARLHTADGSHLLRRPLTQLEEEWGPAGFVRIHRSLLVALAHVDEVRMEGGRCTVVVGDADLVVSRRHTPQLRELLTRSRK